MVEYDGTSFAGFQLQANLPTIQGELEKAIECFTNQPTRVRGASRTDSGAHALGQVVDFLTESRHPIKTFEGALNYYLPEDIRVVRAAEVCHQFHSRRNAIAREYTYTIVNRPNPPAIGRRLVHWVSEPLNLEGMNEAAGYLVGTHDFRAFVPGHPAEKSAVRRIDRWNVERSEASPNSIAITAVGSGFMQRQIRRTNGILVEIGRGKLPVGHVAELLEQPHNPETELKLRDTPSLPAKGLCLVRVEYPNPW